MRREDVGGRGRGDRLCKGDVQMISRARKAGVQAQRVKLEVGVVLEEIALVAFAALCSREVLCVAEVKNAKVSDLDLAAVVYLEVVRLWMMPWWWKYSRPRRRRRGGCSEPG